MMSATLILYIVIFVSTSYLAGRSQGNLMFGEKFEVKWLIIAFLVHWVFCAFTRIGTDHEQYLYIINYSSEYRFQAGEEIGFNGLCMFLYSLTHNAEICIFFIKTISLLLFYIGFYLLRKHVIMSMCVFAYNVTTYLLGYYILAMYLAIALVFVAGALMINNKYPYVAVAVAILGAMVHNSCVLMVVCFVGILILNRFKIKTGLILFSMLLIISLVAISYSRDMMRYVFSNTDTFAAYEEYEEERTRGGSGLFNYFLYGVLLVYVIVVVKSRMKSFSKNAIVVFYLTSFVFSIIGYSIGLSRLNYYSVVFTAIAIPFYFYQVKYKGLKGGLSVIDNKTLSIGWWGYLLFRMVTCLIKYMSSNSSSELNHYEMFNPFVV